MSAQRSHLGGIVLFLTVSTTIASGEVIDPARAKVDSTTSLSWYDLRLLDLEGKGWQDTQAHYDRLPARAEKLVRPAVWNLSRHSAGLCVRFQTDAATMHVRWTLTGKNLALPHMPATGVSGVDLYMLKDGRWQWLSCARPTESPTNTVALVSGLPSGKHSFLLYLPLYNGVSSVEIGIPKDQRLAKGEPRPEGRRKPIVFYGTSITQGGCASRPGMVHTAILGRRLDYPVINLGFSGNGRMEPEVGGLMAELDAAAYVIDCLPNMQGKEVSERTEPLVSLLRKARPQTPILLVEDRTYSNAPLLPAMQQRHRASRQALKKAFDKLVAAGVKEVHYLAGDKLLGDDGEATVDGSHPTDLGFIRQADAFQAVLEPLLGIRREKEKENEKEGDEETALVAGQEKPERVAKLSRGYSIPLIDLAEQKHRQVIVDREPGQYLGHPTTVLLEDNKTMVIVYPKGHGRGGIVMKRSHDGGLTWSERLPTPKNWETSLETPTIHRVIDPKGVKRLILFSGLHPIRMAVSDDDGKTWSELQAIGDFGGIVTMASVDKLQNGDYMALFHDDGRFLRKDGKKTSPRVVWVYKTISKDGGLTWGQPVMIATHPTAQLCEPGLVRSPDGKQIAVLFRENSRKFNGFVIFSDDEGQSWTKPREVPGALTGDRHTARYAPDGRLFITFRDTTLESPTKGDWVGWVGTYDDIVQGREGQYRVRLMKNHKGYDCAYPGLELLPDGTFVTTTYGHWVAGEQPFIVSVRFKMKELDELARGKN